MLKKIFIYGLIDPRNNKIRYVGKTSRTTKRLWEHIRHVSTEKSKKNNWIKKLITLGMKPSIKILEVVKEENWKEKEIFWIEKLSKTEHLTNLTVGGDSPATFNMRPVAKIDPRTYKIIDTYPSIAEAARLNDIKSESRIFDSCSGKCLYSKGVLWRYLDKDGQIIQVQNKRARAVAQINYKNMEIKNIFATVYEVRKFGYDVANVHSVCNGKTRSCYGHIWRYIDTQKNLVVPTIRYKNKMVNRLSLKGEFLERYENANQAALSISIKNPNLILRACKNEKYTAYNFRWQFNAF